MAQLDRKLDKSISYNNNLRSDSFLYRFLIGVSDIFPSFPREYEDPTGGGFSADAKAMKNDFGNIAKDMRRAIKKYEQTEAN